MPQERFFSEQTFIQNKIITLVDREHHHLSRVMRVKVNAVVELVNGQGQLAKASVISIEKKVTSLKILSLFHVSQVETQIIIAQAIPKLNRLDFIVEKGTELGMSELWLFPSEKSEKKNLSINQILRLQGIAISAMKQCGRLFLPKIKCLPSLTSWECLPSNACFGDLSSESPPLLKVWKDLIDPFFFFIGPESGFTENEIKFLRAGGILGVRLHPNILRTDTAPIAAITLISHFSMYTQTNLK